MLWYKDWVEQLHSYFEPVPDIGTCHLETSYATHANS